MPQVIMTPSPRAIGGAPALRRPRCGSARALAAACSVGLALLLAAPSAAAETSGDRFDRALSEASRGVTLGPTSPAGLDAHLALGEAQGLAPLIDGGWPRVEAVARRLAARARTPWLRGEAQAALAAAARHVDPARARAHARAAGALLDGAVLGPLPGAVGDVAPPLPFDPAAELPGKITTVGWREFTDISVLGPIEVADLLGGPGADSHAFVLVALEVDRPVDALVVAGSNGPVAVWLDGAELFAWDGERPLTDWQHAAPVRLEAGVHHLLARAGHRTEDPRLTLRLVDRDGLAPAGVRARPPRAADALAAHGPSTRLPPPLPELAGDAPRRVGHVGLFVVTDSLAQRTAAQALEVALAARPGDAELAYLLGRAERADISRAALAFERAIERSGGEHASAVAALLDLHRSQGLDAGADALARRLVDIDPRHPAVLAHDALRRLEHGDAGAALPVLRGDPRLATNPRLATTWATLLDEAGRHRQAADAWAAAARLVDGAPDVARKAIVAARLAGDVDAAVAFADEALARRPWATSLHILKARALAAGPGGPAAGLAALQPALARHPASPELLETAGRLSLIAGDRGGALAAFDRALELAPQNRDLADYRRTLVSERSLAERFAEPLDAVLATPAPPEAPEGAVFLLERHAVQVFPNGLSSHFRQLVIRLDADSASERYKQMLFPFTPGEDRVEILEAEVLHPDGRRSRPAGIFDHRPAGKQSGVYTLRAMKVVTFEGLGAGDIIHLQVRKDEVGERNLFGDFFGTIIPLSADVAKARVEVVIDAPADRELFVHSEGVAAPARERDEAAGRQRLTWSAQALAPIAVEPRMPGYGDVGAYINVSTFSSWAALADWYRDLVRPQLDVPPELARVARELVAGRDDVREQVAAIQAWVVQKTRYVGIEFGIHGFKPYKVAEVVKRGYGDCKDKTSLLVAMLREVGVDAEFVLVRTRDNGSLAPSPPTLWAFNHAIAYVPALDAYIDGTSEFAGLDELPVLDQGALALRIDLFAPSRPAPTLTHIPIAPPAANRSVAETVFTIDPTGDATARFAESIAGSDAAILRSRLEDEARRDELLAAVLAGQHPGATITAVRYENLDRLGAPIGIHIEARLPGLGRRVGDALEVPVSLDPGGLLERYGRLAHREQPLVLDNTLLELDTTAVTLPPGATPTLPPPTRIARPFGRFEQEFERTAGGYTVRTTLEVTTALVAPADYPGFRAFLEAIARAEAVRVVVGLEPGAP